MGCPSRKAPFIGVVETPRAPRIEIRKTHFRLNDGNPPRLPDGLSPLGKKPKEGQGLRGERRASGPSPTAPRRSCRRMPPRTKGPRGAQTAGSVGPKRAIVAGFDSGGEVADAGVVAHEAAGKREKRRQDRERKVARDGRRQSPGEKRHDFGIRRSLDPDERPSRRAEEQGKVQETLLRPVLARASARRMESDETGSVKARFCPGIPGRRHGFPARCRFPAAAPRPGRRAAKDNDRGGRSRGCPAEDEGSREGEESRASRVCLRGAVSSPTQRRARRPRKNDVDSASSRASSKSARKGTRSIE